MTARKAQKPLVVDPSVVIAAGRWKFTLRIKPGTPWPTEAETQEIAAAVVTALTVPVVPDA